MISLFLIVAVIIVGAVVALFFIWRRAYLTHPLQSSLRALTSVLTTLVAILAVPSFRLDLTYSVEALPGGSWRVEEFVIANGADSYWAVAIGSITLLIAICLLRVPSDPHRI